MKMFANTNDFLAGRKQVKTPSGGELVSVRFALKLKTTDLVTNGAGAIGILPPGTVPVSLIFDSDDLDTNAAPTVVASVGLLNDAGTDLATVWVSGITACQSGAAFSGTSTAMVREAQSLTSDRKIGIKFTTGAASAQAGEVGLTLIYRSA
ncbi:hypothetical protein SAMN02982919_00198 [Giesbergeria anulus]|uniref:Uncharacterized protein n=2 Tax=Giesbergeria anulus TaxID=180197 RepID=A0A1H9E4C9_9BURK|nr:hypothetical protein SAMN02982919_00198 [Giesbergeria anulus]